MRSRELEEKIVKLEDLIGLWNRFNEIAGAVVKGAEITDEIEREFLELKSALARKYQSLADRFHKRVFPDDDVNNVLSQAVSLGRLQGLNAFAASEFQNQWHKVYIAFNRQLGHLESERDQLRKVSISGIIIKKIFRGKLFKFIVIVLVIAGLFAAGQRLGYIGVVEENGDPDAEEASGLELLRDRVIDFINSLRRGGAEETENDGIKE